MRGDGATQLMRLGMTIALLLVVAVVVAAPIGAVVASAGWGPKENASGTIAIGWNPILFAKTLGWAALIAAIATALALPCGWFAGRRGLWVSVLACVMLLLPTYLASSGWGLIRAPGTMVGDLLERLTEGERRWIPIAVSRGLAIAGLAMWATPLAMLVIAGSVRRVPVAAEEALRLEASSWLHAAIERIKMIKGGVVGGFVLVLLVMLGSAVPLHLAQIETYSTKLWLMLDESSQGEKWKVWVSAWPLFAVAAAGGLILRRLARDVNVEVVDGESQKRGGGFWLSIGVIGLGVALPLVSFALSIHHVSSFATVWAASRDAAMTSLSVAGVCAVAGVLLAAWMASGQVGRHAQIVAIVGFGVMALVPGVLVGGAVAALWRGGPSWVSETWLIVVLAHIARFGIVGVLSGVFATRSETVSEQEMRRFEGGDGLKGWIRGCLPWQWGILAAGGLAMGALSFQEIEASIMVLPPGVESLARDMLQHLHFARTEELSVTSVIVVSIGLGIAGLAAGLAVLGYRKHGQNVQRGREEVGKMGISGS